MDRRVLGWILRLAALLVVLCTALYAFDSGVELSYRPGVARADWLTQLYYAAGLFVLGGMDLGTPVAGPQLARAALWVAYFAAPAITTTAVIEGALRLVGSGTLERFGLRRHIVVVGLGRLGSNFVGALREWRPKQIIVAVERDVSQASVAHVKRQHHVRVLQGDARLARIFDGLALDRARGAALMTGDDLLNLEVAYALAARYPALPIVAHVTDVGVQRAVTRVYEAGTQRKPVIFNVHLVAAARLYERYLRQHFASTSAKDAIVLAGFGRFGQTILEYLLQEARGDLGKVLVLDRRAELELRTFSAHVKPVACTPAALDTDLADPASWIGAERELGSLDLPPVVIVGTNDDLLNLRSAIWIRERWPHARLFVRCQKESPFTRDLAQQVGFTVLAVETILREALLESQKAWFTSHSANAT